MSTAQPGKDWVKVTCPSCRHAFQVKPQPPRAGRPDFDQSVACTRCHHRFPIPGTKSSAGSTRAGTSSPSRPSGAIGASKQAKRQVERPAWQKRTWAERGLAYCVTVSLAHVSCLAFLCGCVFGLVTGRWVDALHSALRAGTVSLGVSYLVALIICWEIRMRTTKGAPVPIPTFFGVKQTKLRSEACDIALVSAFILTPILFVAPNAAQLLPAEWRPEHDWLTTLTVAVYLASGWSLWQVSKVFSSVWAFGPVRAAGLVAGALALVATFDPAQTVATTNEILDRFNRESIPQAVVDVMTVPDLRLGLPPATFLGVLIVLNCVFRPIVLLLPSRSSRWTSTTRGRCKSCGKAFEDAVSVGDGPMSAGEFFGRMAQRQVQVRRAMVCDSCNSEVCLFCAVQAARHRQLSKPVCPLCGRPVHEPGAFIVPPSAALYCDSCNGPIRADDAYAISPQAQVPRDALDVARIHCRKCATRFFERNGQGSAETLHTAHQLAIEHLRLTRRIPE